MSSHLQLEIHGKGPDLSHGRHKTRSCQSGFTYFWVLIAVFVMALGLTAVSAVWANSAARQRMTDLDWKCGEITAAIGNYYQSTPGLPKKFPASLNDLLDDRRQGFTRRHIREIYVNPASEKGNWIVSRAADGGINGVAVHAKIGSEEINRQYLYDPSLNPDLTK